MGIEKQLIFFNLCLLVLFPSSDIGSVVFGVMVLALRIFLRDCLHLTQTVYDKRGITGLKLDSNTL
jgi:hypothetical protein